MIEAPADAIPRVSENDFQNYIISRSIKLERDGFNQQLSSFCKVLCMSNAIKLSNI